MCLETHKLSNVLLMCVNTITLKINHREECIKTFEIEWLFIEQCCRCLQTRFLFDIIFVNMT